MCILQAAVQGNDLASVLALAHGTAGVAAGFADRDIDEDDPVLEFEDDGTVAPLLSCSC